MSVILMITLIGQVCGQVGINAHGVVDEMVVTAPAAQVEMLSEVVVTAPRYEGETVSSSGMLPEVVVTARRHDTGMNDDPITIYGARVPVHTLGIILY